MVKQLMRRLFASWGMAKTSALPYSYDLYMIEAEAKLNECDATPFLSVSEDSMPHLLSPATGAKRMK